MVTRTISTLTGITLFGIAVLLAGAPGGRAWSWMETANAQVSPPKPNILVILADDLGYADISAYKLGRFRTPNIDRIGMQGVRFTDAYATAPVCGPSRAGLMTGRYQDRFGFEYNNGGAQRDLAQGLGLAAGETTIAQLLKGSGYHTGIVGKWHLGSQPQFYPMNRGFDEYVGFLPGESSYMNPDRSDVHLAFRGFDDRTLHAVVHGHSSQTVDLSADEDFGGREARLADTFSRGSLNSIVEGKDRTIVHNEGQYLTDYFGDRAVEFIARASRQEPPYFLYLAFNAVHAPLMVTSKYYDRFPDIKDHQLRVYAAMVAALDDQVGRVLDAVDASGQANNTVIFFASDNGCAAYMPGLCSCTPLRGGKLSHYEGGVRVPFMMRWPGHVKAGTVYRDVVSLMDVLPTSVAAAGGELPRDRIYDGVDVLPYLTGQKTGAPHSMLAWRRLPLFSIRQGDWKLWESVDDKTGQYGQYKLLFNLKSDLNETRNVADKFPDKVKELEALVYEWQKSLIDPKWPSKRPLTYTVCGTPFTLPI